MYNLLMKKHIRQTLNYLKCIPRTFVILFITLISLFLASCSTVQGMHARVTYEFKQISEEQRVFYEPGTERAADIVSQQLSELIKQVEISQFMQFKDAAIIKVYLFNDPLRYKRFRYNTGAQSLGGSTTNEVFLSLPTIRKRLASELCQKEVCLETVEGILLHELSHIHLRQYLGSWRYVTDVPQWFHEGFATLISGGAGAGRVSVKDARDLILSGSHLLPHSSGRYFQRNETVGDLRFGSFTFYRQSVMFVSFFAEE